MSVPLYLIFAKYSSPNKIVRPKKSPSSQKRALSSFRHANYRQRQPAFQRNLNLLHSHITLHPEELRSRQRRAHLIARKTRRTGRHFARLKNSASDPLACPCRMNKESPDLRRVALRIQKRILSARPVIATVKRFAFAPATAPSDRPARSHIFCSVSFLCLGLAFCGSGFRNKISPIFDQLTVHAKHRFQCTLHLCWRVVLYLQSSHRSLNQLPKYGNLRHNRLPDSNLCLVHSVPSRSIRKKITPTLYCYSSTTLYSPLTTHYVLSLRFSLQKLCNFFNLLCLFIHLHRENFRRRCLVDFLLQFAGQLIQPIDLHTKLSFVLLQCCSLDALSSRICRSCFRRILSLR